MRKEENVTLSRSGRPVVGISNEGVYPLFICAIPERLIAQVETHLLSTTFYSYVEWTAARIESRTFR